VVDDAYDYGSIAAANSLSDVYAMGAKPIFALNIVGFPSNRLPLAVLEEILRGAQDKAQEAGISILGGHTVDDTEPKFGMAVTGLVHPEKVLRNSTAHPGDAIILTKPLGLGILTTALKQGLVDRATETKAIQIMAALNKTAADIMQGFTVSACTDVTGFGLLGHLHEMTAGSRVDAHISLDTVPILPEARQLAAMDVIPGGTVNNLSFVKPHITFAEHIVRIDQLLLADAQTSGGLLISVPKDETDSLLEKLLEKGIQAAIIGYFSKAGMGKITVE
jgi:selenide,water dikinase